MSLPWHAIFIVVGTFLPVLGLGGTFAAAVVVRGLWRWAVLVVGPAVTAASCYAIAEPVMRDGNLLAAVTFILLYLFLLVYYPVLGIVGVAIWIRRRRTET